MTKTFALPLVLAASFGLIACTEPATTETDAANAVNDMETVVEDGANDMDMMADDAMMNDMDAAANDMDMMADDPMMNDMGNTADNAM